MSDMNKEMRMVLYHTDDNDTANKHLKNLYAEGELQESSTISKMEIVKNEGGRQVKRKVEFS